METVKKEYERQEQTAHNTKKMIIIGKTNTGKSTSARSYAELSEKTVFYLCGIPMSFHNYEDFYMFNGHNYEIRDNSAPFSVKEGQKYFIYPKVNYEYIFKNAAECIGYGIGDLNADLKTLLLIYDDGAWRHQENKLVAFWNLSHSENDIIITLQDETELFDGELTPEVKKDIQKNWEIIYLT